MIASAVTVPLLVVAALALVAATDDSSSSSSSKGPGGALNLSAPPEVTAQAAACTKVLAGLPVQLTTLDPRTVHTKPDTPFVVAWGNPAVILRCGVARPKSLQAGSSTPYYQNGNATSPFYDVTTEGGSNVFTTVDRAAYVSITVPSKYQGATVVPPLSDAIGKALPAVCGVPDSNGSTGSLPLCTQRR